MYSIHWGGNRMYLGSKPRGRVRPSAGRKPLPCLVGRELGPRRNKHLSLPRPRPLSLQELCSSSAVEAVESGGAIGGPPSPPPCACLCPLTWAILAGQASMEKIATDLIEP